MSCNSNKHQKHMFGKYLCRIQNQGGCYVTWMMFLQLHINTVNCWNPAQVDSITNVDMQWCSSCLMMLTCGATLHDQVPHPTQNFLLWWRISHQFLNLLSRAALEKHSLNLAASCGWFRNIQNPSVGKAFAGRHKTAIGFTWDWLVSGRSHQPSTRCAKMRKCHNQHLRVPDSLAFQQLPSTLTGVLEPSWSFRVHDLHMGTLFEELGRFLMRHNKSLTCSKVKVTETIQFFWNKRISI